MVTAGEAEGEELLLQRYGSEHVARQTFLSPPPKPVFTVVHDSQCHSRFARSKQDIVFKVGSVGVGINALICRLFGVVGTCKGPK